MDGRGRFPDGATLGYQHLDPGGQRQGRLDRVQERLEAATVDLDRLGEQRVEIVEVAIDRAKRHAGLGCDLSGRRLGDSRFEQGDDGRQHRVTTALAPGMTPVACRVSTPAHPTNLSRISPGHPICSAPAHFRPVCVARHRPDRFGGKHFRYRRSGGFQGSRRWSMGHPKRLVVRSGTPRWVGHPAIRWVGGTPGEGWGDPGGRWEGSHPPTDRRGRRIPSRAAGLTGCAGHTRLRRPNRTAGRSRWPQSACPESTAGERGASGAKRP